MFDAGAARMMVATIGLLLGTLPAGPGTRHAAAADGPEWVCSADELTGKGLPVFNVRDFGAVGDGKKNEQPAMQSAIEAASAAEGGVVFIPSGLYLLDT